uniref:Transmembrane protein 81 n=1 Tax=Acanthochromis polyacanthus TaxID=80966 RepID=A0A3Q1EI74_9TELE
VLPSHFTMHLGSVGFYLHVLLLFHRLSSVALQEVDEVPVEVITNSSPCSSTCGLGVKTQTLCLMEDGKVSEVCRVRKVRCLDSWQCGLRTMTVTSGQKVEIDCLGEVMKDDSCCFDYTDTVCTYRCDVQDASFRRVKRAYWGIRVLPAGILNLDYESSQAQRESTGNQQSQTVPRQSPLLLLMVLLVPCFV